MRIYVCIFFFIFHLNSFSFLIPFLGYGINSMRYKNLPKNLPKSANTYMYLYSWSYINTCLKHQRFVCVQVGSTWCHMVRFFEHFYMFCLSLNAQTNVHKNVHTHIYICIYMNFWFIFDLSNNAFAKLVTSLVWWAISIGLRLILIQFNGRFFAIKEQSFTYAHNSRNV